MITPFFAKNRYGREDILAMMPKDASPPTGLRNCPYFVENAQPPIILSGLSETELRSQHNINSSKALSLLSPAERTAIQNAGVASQSSSPWLSTNTNKNAKRGNRWSALTMGDSPGGSTYVKSRSGSAASSGRGGGTAGSIRNRSVFDTTKGISTPTSRSSGEEYPSWATADPDDEECQWEMPDTPVSVFSTEENDIGMPLKAKVHNWQTTDNETDLMQPTTTTEGLNAGKRLLEIITTDNREKTDAILGHSFFDRSKMVPTSRFRPSIEEYLSRTTSRTRDDKPDWRISDSYGQDDFIMKREPEIVVDGVEVQQRLEQLNISMSPPLKQPLPSPHPSEVIDTNILINLENKVLPVDAPPVIQKDLWFYLAPNGDQHGPFDAHQMVVWYKSGFFTQDLRCRRSNDVAYATLAQYIQHNGVENPFVSSQAEAAKPEPPTLNDIWKYSSTKERLRLLKDSQEQMQKEEDLRRQQEEAAWMKVKEMIETSKAAEEHQRQVKLALEQEQMQKEKELWEQQDEFGWMRQKALSEARKAAEKEYRRQMKFLQEQQRLRKQQLEQQSSEERRYQEELRMRATRVQQLAEAQRCRETEDVSVFHSPKSPWVTPSMKDQHHTGKPHRSLFEILLGEEKSLEEERRMKLEFSDLRKDEELQKHGIEKQLPEERKYQEELRLRAMRVQQLVESQRRHETEDTGAFQSLKSTWITPPVKDQNHAGKSHRSLLDILIKEKKSMEEESRMKLEFCEHKNDEELE